jgi:hypothetical protein
MRREANLGPGEGRVRQFRESRGTRGRLGATVVVSAQVVTALSCGQAGDGSPPRHGTARIPFRHSSEQARQGSMPRET